MMIIFVAVVIRTLKIYCPSNFEYDFYPLFPMHFMVSFLSARTLAD